MESSEIVPSGTARSNQNADHTIAVLDSGVGGLSVCQSILADNPKTHIVYLADDRCFPYGVMTEAALSERVFDLVEHLVDLHSPSLVVLACNTVSTLLLPELRARFDIPFVGVVPAIKPAVSVSKTQKVGVLATPATVTRHYLDDLIEQFADGCEVFRLGSEELVRMAEDYLKDGALDETRLMEVLAPLMSNKGMDTVVLGCTHFPLFREQLESLYAGITWIDSGEAIARRVADVLKRQLDSTQALQASVSTDHTLYFTRRASHSEHFLEKLKAMGFGNVQIKSLERS